ncbi:MAG: hypothetical protein ACLQPD_19775 [Desulfomonilaceae bacterium]
MDWNTPETIENIRRVAEEKGLKGNYRELSEELNRRRITNLRGGEWTRKNLGTFCNRHSVFKEPRPVAIATQDTSDIPRPEVPDKVSQIPQLDAETVAVLREIVSWWKARGAEAMTRKETTEPAYRPNFPGTRRNTGIRINARLLQDALAKAQTPAESTKMGGGLSPLIERLLWEYMEFNPKYLTRDDG